MTRFQAYLLAAAGACFAFALFMHHGRALSRRGLIAVAAVTAAITGFLYWAQ